MSPSFKIAFIGSHGVGKTTLCYGVAARLKARDVTLDVVGEVARRCPLPINEETTEGAQAWILHTQIAEEILAAARCEVLICDRSVLDNFVYLLLAAEPPAGLHALVDGWLATYDLLVHVPVVEEPSADGLRATDPGFQQMVEERLEREISRRDREVLRLHGSDRSDWLDEVERIVLQRLAVPQLPLL